MTGTEPVFKRRVVQWRYPKAMASNPFFSEDPAIRRQKFVCVSILTPNDVDVRNKAYFEARAFALATSSDESYDTIEDYDAAFDAWRAGIQTTLDDQFKRHSSGKPHIPIMKVRGTYNTMEEAADRCRFLAKGDPISDIWVAPVGMWVPADGKARSDETDIEYTDKQMRSLVQRR